MDPFNAAGPSFLGFYFVSAVVLWLIAHSVKQALRTPADEPSMSVDLDPFEIAYLDGGDNKLADTVLANLVHRGILRVGSISNVVTRVGTLPADATELEKAVFEAAESPFDTGRAVRSRFATPVLTMRQYAKVATKPIIASLQKHGLLLKGEQETLAKWMPWLIAMIAPLLLAMPKILIGWGRGKPTGFLIAMFLYSLFAAAWLVPRYGVSMRSVRGDKLLKRLKDANATLFTAAKSGANLPAGDLSKAFALFGVAALASMPMMTDLHTLLRPSYGGNGSGSSSGSCGGGGSCSGGCGGGGGCGGCGG